MPDLTGAHLEPHVPRLASTRPHDPADLAPTLRRTGRLRPRQVIRERIAAGVSRHTDPRIGLDHRRGDQLLGELTRSLRLVGRAQPVPDPVRGWRSPTRDPPPTSRRDGTLRAG